MSFSEHAKTAGLVTATMALIVVGQWLDEIDARQPENPTSTCTKKSPAEVAGLEGEITPGYAQLTAALPAGRLESEPGARALGDDATCQHG